jgi:hypothetical protein
MLTESKEGTKEGRKEGVGPKEVSSTSLLVEKKIKQEDETSKR